MNPIWNTSFELFSPTNLSYLCLWAPATGIVFDPSGTGLDRYLYTSPILAAVIADVMSEGLPALTKIAS